MVPLRTAQLLCHGVHLPRSMYWILKFCVTVPSKVLIREKPLIPIYGLEFQEMHGVPKFGALALEF